MLVKLHKNKGITLIALIITVIMLLILAGVAVNMLVGEDGILSHTKTSTEKYSIEAEKEALRLEILNIQTEILKTEGRKATLEDLQERIDLAKYEIEMHYEPVATSTPVETPATYVIVKRIGTNYYFTVDDKLVITNVEEITEENSPISKFTISLSDTTYKDTTVTLNETPTSEAGTIEKYDYVAQTTENKIELTNITETTKKITGLTEQTTYKVYVIAYDNAGNKRKSNIVSITTPEYTPPQISNPSTANRTGNNLDVAPYNYSWDEIEALAKAISDDNRNTITYTTTQVTITMEGKIYTIGVGDYKNVTYGGTTKRVRILGFNHDILATLTDTEVNLINHYGGTNTYAGISFEFVDFMLPNYAKMNSTDTNIGGWASCSLRTTLNNDINNISIKNKIKEVIKTYNKGNKGSTNGTCTDKLWLLSCSEIWQNGSSSGYYGLCNTKEGEQYAYYKINTGSTSYDNIGQTATIKQGLHWWLRSPNSYYSNTFCYVDENGSCSVLYALSPQYVAPGFSI